MSEELKPCPFCGSPAEIREINWILCTDTVNCGAEVGSGYSGDSTKEFTINAWNNRVVDIAAPVKELEGTLPLVLYFGNDKDRDEFISVFHEAMPNAVSKKL